jgi:predicted nucleotidyltransferase
MRITTQQQQALKELVLALGGAEVYVFGSRLDDNQRGGDVDILVQVAQTVDNPAWLSALISAKASRLFDGRQVDVVLAAPNLAQSSIHAHAYATGVRL